MRLICDIMNRSSALFKGVPLLCLRTTYEMRCCPDCDAQMDGNDLGRLQCTLVSHHSQVDARHPSCWRSSCRANLSSLIHSICTTSNRQMTRRLTCSKHMAAVGISDANPYLSNIRSALSVSRAAKVRLESVITPRFYTQPRTTATSTHTCSLDLTFNLLSAKESSTAPCDLRLHRHSSVF